MKNRTGQCYCGTVKYEIQGDFGFIVHCHCRNCRRVTGSVAYTAAFMREENFSITAGQEEIREYFPTGSGPFARTFCGKCGGRLSVKLPIPGIINIALTTLDQEPDEDVGVHINLESKAPWQTVGDARPQYESFPPDMQELFQNLMHEKG